MPPQNFAFGPFVLDSSRGVLLRDGQPVALGHKALLLLKALVQALGDTVSKAQLLDIVWPDTAVEESNLSVQIAALRKLLGPSPDGTEWIVTIPRIGYRFAASPSAAPAPSEPVEPTEASKRPSIAILPFSNLSGDGAQDYLADGITEDIITALTRFRWFRVAGRGSSFLYKGKSVDSKQIATELDVQYLLEGSVRRSGQALRISVQLVEGKSGKDIWAERYDIEMTDAFAVQDAIAERVAAAIEPELLKTDSVAAASRHTGNMTAWDLVRQGTWHFHQVQRDGHLKALALFREACRLDPELPEAQLWLARVGAAFVAYGWANETQYDIREALDAAVKAIHLDERNPYAHYGLAIASCYAELPEQGKRAAERAIEISPTFALGYMVLGIARLLSGQATEAAAAFDNGLRLNPNDPQNFVWFSMLAFAQYFSGKPEQALNAAVKAVKIRPTWRPAFEIIALCHATSGRADDAARSVAQMRELQASNVFDPIKRRNPHWQEQIAATLRPAGWLE